MEKDSDHAKEDFSEEYLNHYISLNNEILDKYGVSEEYLKLLKKRKRYLIQANGALAKGDKYKLWKAERLKREIDNALAQEPTGKREDSLINISRFVYNGPINPMKITLDEYHYNIDYTNRMIEIQNKSVKK